MSSECSGTGTPGQRQQVTRPPMFTRALAAWRRVLTGALSSVIGCCPALAAGPAGIVEVEREPFHRVVFTNADVRVLEVGVPAGKATLYHRHRADNVAVVLRDAQAATQRFGDPDSIVSLRKAGAVYFSPAPQDGYVHRVRAGPGDGFQLVDVELLTGPSGEAPAEFAVTNVSVENDRIRAFTVDLQPGASSTALTLRKGIVVVIPGATVVQVRSDGRSDRIVSTERAWRWREPGTWTLRNESLAPATVIEVEIK